jgi:hypothetical protein
VEVPALSCQAERSAPDGLVAPMVADLSSLAVHSDGCDLADCPACSLAAGPVGLVPDDLRSDDSHQDDLHPDALNRAGSAPASLLLGGCCPGGLPLDGSVG